MSLDNDGAAGNYSEFQEDYDTSDPEYEQEVVLTATGTLLDLVASGFVALVLTLSVILNLANISTVASISRLRSCGYFHILALMSAFNVVYFVAKALLVAFITLERLALMPEFISDWYKMNNWMGDMTSDLMFGLVGLQILLLCVMTLEHRVNLSRQFFFKPKGQTCMRSFLTILALVLVAVSLTISSLIRFKIFVIFSHDEKPDHILPSLIIYSIYLMIFTCLPAFVLVIVAVVNCVSAWNSTRLQPPEIKLAQKLDWKLAIVGSVLIVALVVTIIVTMAYNINAYANSGNVLIYLIYGLQRFLEMLLISIPITIASIFGKRCCCWCCCRPCRPPIDDLDD